MTAALPPALVLAAGLGLRLRPLTCRRAKPAVPVANVPLIRRILSWLRRSGVRDVVVNLHYRPQTITGVVGDGRDLDLRIRYSWERRILGTAGGPRHALDLLGPTFLIVNGDTLTDVDLAGLVGAHADREAKVTLATIPSPDPHRYGGVDDDEQHRVRGFSRPGQTDRAAHFIGVQVVEASVFASLADGVAAATIGGLYDDLLTRIPGSVCTYPTTARFLDIGTPDDYVRTSASITAEEQGRPAGLQTTAIHPDATLVRTIVWDRVTIARHATLTDCIVMDDVRVQAGARFEREILLPADAAADIDGRRVGDVVAVPLGPDARKSNPTTPL